MGFWRAILTSVSTAAILCMGCGHHKSYTLCMNLSTKQYAAFSFFQHKNQNVSFHHSQNQCLYFCLTKVKVQSIEGTDVGGKGDHFGGLCPWVWGGGFLPGRLLRLRPTGLGVTLSVGLSPVHSNFLCQIWFQTAFGISQVSNSHFKGRFVSKEDFLKNIQKVVQMSTTLQPVNQTYSYSIW